MCNDVIIRVENLGKKYRIRHQQERQCYVALRDVIADAAKKPWRWLRGRTTKPQTIDHQTGPVVSSPLVSSSRATREDFWALKGVSFEVRRGEVVGIIGRNGAGKSTLLKILSRITEPTTGRIRIKGRVASLLEVGTGFHPELTGRENIFLNGAILGMSRAEIKKKFDEIVAFAEVEKFLDTPVKRYSSGMYVRLAFAVAAHLEPEILVVDEVLAVGDAEFQKKCLGKMRDASRREGRTVLFVSHNMAAIKSLCSNAYLLETGQVVKSGTADQVVSHYLNSVFKTMDMDDRCLSERRDRVGGQLLRLTTFSVVGPDGRLMADVACGKKVSLELGFQTFTSKINNLRFGITFTEKSSATSVTDLNSYHRSAEIFLCEQGIHKFVFTINRMPLAPGQYNLNFIVTSGLMVLDWIKDACPLTVSDGAFYEESGQMPLPGNFPIFFAEFDCGFGLDKKVHC